MEQLKNPVEEDQPTHSAMTPDISVLVEENCAWFRDLVLGARPNLNSSGDLFAVCLHALMLELGFTSELSRDELISFCSWRTAAGWFLSYRFPDESGGGVHRFCLSIFSLGNKLTKVHGLSVSNKAAYFTTKLSPDEYVHGVKEDSWSLGNVRQLARVFKNEVGYPLLQTARLLTGCQAAGLFALPPELAVAVLVHLDAKSLLRLAASCKQMDQLCRTESIWQRLVRRDFKKVEKRSSVGSWREFYRILVKEKKSQAELMRALVCPPLQPPSPHGFFPPDFPPVFPGIIGGDHDIFPPLPGLFGPRQGGRRAPFDERGRPDFFRGNPPGFGGWGGGGGPGGFL